MELVVQIDEDKAEFEAAYLTSAAEKHMREHMSFDEPLDLGWVDRMRDRLDLVLRDAVNLGRATPDAWESAVGVGAHGDDVHVGFRRKFRDPTYACEEE